MTDTIPLEQTVSPFVELVTVATANQSPTPVEDELTRAVHAVPGYTPLGMKHTIQNREFGCFHDAAR